MGTTMWHCSDELIGRWPHTKEPVKTLRLFWGWKDEWGPQAARDKAWANLQKFVKMNNAKILFGTPVSCNATADDAQWATVLQLMKLLGPEHVLAVGVGNEMDMFAMEHGPSLSCVNDLWSKGRFFNLIKKVVADMDSNGFSNASITSVWGIEAI